VAVLPLAINKVTNVGCGQSLHTSQGAGCGAVVQHLFTLVYLTILVFIPLIAGRNVADSTLHYIWWRLRAFPVPEILNAKREDDFVEARMELTKEEKKKTKPLTMMLPTERDGNTWCCQEDAEKKQLEGLLWVCNWKWWKADLLGEGQKNREDDDRLEGISFKFVGRKNSKKFRTSCSSHGGSVNAAGSV
jgi:hypothetical protein